MSNEILSTCETVLHGQAVTVKRYASRVMKDSIGRGSRAFMSKDSNEIVVNSMTLSNVWQISHDVIIEHIKSIQARFFASKTYDVSIIDMLNGKSILDYYIPGKTKEFDESHITLDNVLKGTYNVSRRAFVMLYMALKKDCVKGSYTAIDRMFTDKDLRRPQNEIYGQESVVEIYDDQDFEVLQERALNGPNIFERG